MNAAELANVLTLHAQWLNGDSKGKRADLTGADLRDADLTGADLRDADLRDADLTGADLNDADLRRASLRGAVLNDADLRRASLNDADLRGAKGYRCAGRDNRGYHFRAVTSVQPGGITITAGCRVFTLDQAVAHWTAKNNKDALARVAVLALLADETA